MEAIPSVARSIYFFRVLLVSIVIVSALVGKTANSQTSPHKSLVEQLEAEEEKERKTQNYQGMATTATDALSRARKDAKSNTTGCEPGLKPRKDEDVRAYIAEQEIIQNKIAKSIEKFTQNSITKKEAIEEFNKLIAEKNELTKWSWGRVTNGTCGPKSITDFIGKVSNATDILFNQYRQAITQ